jgi:Protein of unknown function (DUF3987)
MNALTESPPEKESPASSETSGTISQITMNNYTDDSTLTRSPQLEADGLPPIMSAEEFLSMHIEPPIGLKEPIQMCLACGGELAEDYEIEHLQSIDPNYEEHERCTCLENGPEFLQALLVEQRRVWAEAAKEVKVTQKTVSDEPVETVDDEHEYKRIDAVDFPDRVNSDAFHGIAGKVTKMLCTGSELKPEAVLAQFLCIFGNMLGRAPYKIQDGRHGTLINVAIVGNTADGAKGSSYQAVKRLIRAVDSDYCTDNIKGGYNSSEALIADITDEVMGMKKGQEIVVEEGVNDKRLLVVEEEFSRILQIGKRDGVTLSEILRQCFDLPDALRAPSRKSNLVSTNPFVSILGHITPEGLKKSMDSVEAFNGFANRFMFIASKRTASVPEPPVIDWTEGRASDILYKLQTILKIYCPHPLSSSTNPDLVFKFSQKAKEKWAEIYHEISRQSANKHGYAGAIIARAKPTILRLSMIYSALDSTSFIETTHLDAAKALWDYAANSATWCFEGMSGSREANDILRYLKRYPNGVSRTLILGDVFRNNMSASKLTEALSELRCSGFADMKKIGKAETWFPTS